MAPTHSNNTLTETDVVETNEKDVSTVGDSGKPGHQTDRGSEHTTEDEDVFWVDWEGPDDPANPKKCVALN